MRRWDDEGSARVRIEIIPMIDVMMFLLVFFVLISINVIPAWTDPAMTEKCLAWAQGFGSLLSELGASDAYVNYLSEEGSPAVKASYGTNYAQLAALKKKYDPDNFFRFNQNIVPAD